MIRNPASDDRPLSERLGFAPLPEAAVDIEFFRQLRDLSATALLAAMFELGLRGDAASMANAFEMFVQDGAPKDLEALSSCQLPCGADHSDVAVGISYQRVVALALAPLQPSHAMSAGQGPLGMEARLRDVKNGTATIAFAMPPERALSAGQQALFDRAMHVFAAQPNGNDQLDDFLVHCAQTVEDPREGTGPLDRLIGAGASVKAKGLLYRNQKTVSKQAYEAPLLALARGNVAGFQTIIAHLDDPQFFEELIVAANVQSTGAMNPARVLSSSMMLNGRSFSGLRCMRLIEDNLGPLAKDPDFNPLMILNFRAQVLSRYLLSSANCRIGWDPLQVEFMMGQAPGAPGMPAQCDQLNFGAWDQLSNPVTGWLITVALQTHCWPVLERLKDMLLTQDKEGTLPDPKTAGVPPGGAELAHKSSVLSAMLTPVNPDHRVNWENFDRCLTLIDSLGLLENESPMRSQSLKKPAMHTLAQEENVDRMELLVRLMDHGLDPGILNMDNRSPTDGMRDDDALEWTSLIASWRARHQIHATVKKSSDPSVNALPC